MSATIGDCITPVSTIFIYDSPSVQNAANTIYVAKNGEYASTISGTPTNRINHDVKLMFKTDFERMQYLIGLYGRTSQGLR